MIQYKNDIREVIKFCNKKSNKIVTLGTNRDESLHFLAQKQGEKRKSFEINISDWVLIDENGLIKVITNTEYENKKHN